MIEFVLSVLPILWLIVALCILKMPGYKACGITCLLTVLIAIFKFQMGIMEVGTAVLEGVLNALWPICVVIIAALFVYNLTLETKAMEDIKSMLANVSKDPMVLVLIIACGFGNFMEGMAGFGTAVAIPAGILVTMGYDPLRTVVACLVANSTPTAFGSVGVPTSTTAAITGLSGVNISGNIALMQCILCLITPFIVVMIASGGIKEVKKNWVFCLVASLSFVVPQAFAAMKIGPELPDIIGSVVSLVIMVVFSILREKPAGFGLDAKDALCAWSPFLLIFIILLGTSSLFPVIHQPLAAVTTKLSVYSGVNPGTLSFAWLDCPGVKIAVAGIIEGRIQKASYGTIWKVFLDTLKKNLKTVFTICSVLATAKIMGYSGMITTIAVILVSVTGSFYPLISPVIGMIGGFVTGSGTSTAVLFGPLQVQTASAVGVGEVWLSAANLVGGGIGKMISPQSVAIGCAAVGLEGQESRILSKTIPHALGFIVVAGCICFIFA